MNLDRLRAALESFDAGPAGSLDLMRRLADVIEAAREVCAASPPDSTTSPQDAPAAAPAPEGASVPDEPVADPSCGDGEVSDELALATAFDPPCPACVATHKFGSSLVYGHTCVR